MVMMTMEIFWTFTARRQIILAAVALSYLFCLILSKDKKNRADKKNMLNANWIFFCPLFLVWYDSKDLNETALSLSSSTLYDDFIFNSRVQICANVKLFYGSVQYYV